jgi:hypothetical protein
LNRASGDFTLQDRVDPMTLPMVRALSTLLDIPAQVLIQDYALRRAA